MAFVEKTGRTVDEAIISALKELKITADEADIEILEQGKKGFLGIGRKDARVRVGIKEAKEEETPEPKLTLEEAVSQAAASVKVAAGLATEAAAEAVASVKEDLKEAAKSISEEIEEKTDAVKQDVANAAKDFGRRVEKSRRERRSDRGARAAERAEKKAQSEPEGETRKYVVSEESVAAAREFLQKVFAAMKIEVVMEKFISKQDGSITFRLHGDDMGILIGKHGQTLDALQYLANLVANKNSEERVRVIIDVEDYRDRRVETLTRLANRLAEKVRRTGERVALEPMNPHERKIIHMALQGDKKVTTLSEGEPPYRHVVIELKSNIGKK